MKILYAVIFCCVSTACLGASAATEVRGRVGGEVTIRCSGNWTTDDSSENYNTYFCKGVCSPESSVLQASMKRPGVTRRGRYSMEVGRGEGASSVTIKNLERGDAGRYHCGVGKTLTEVDVVVLNVSTVPHGSLSSISSLKTEEEPLPQWTGPPSTPSSPTTLPDVENNTKQRATTRLKDTTVVIIISVSLAVLVCAIIPFILYRRFLTNPGCRSKRDANKVEADCCEPNADVASA